VLLVELLPLLLQLSRTLFNCFNHRIGLHLYFSQLPLGLRMGLCFHLLNALPFLFGNSLCLLLKHEGDFHNLVLEVLAFVGYPILSIAINSL
jgi:hypothetical protein